MTDLTWIPLSDSTPAPGDYLTRRDLTVKQDKHGFRQIRAVILPDHWDGERWNLAQAPNYYRAMPEGVK